MFVKLDTTKIAIAVKLVILPVSPAKDRAIVSAQVVMTTLFNYRMEFAEK